MVLQRGYVREMASSSVKSSWLWKKGDALAFLTYCYRDTQLKQTDISQRWYLLSGIDVRKYWRYA